MTTCSVCSVDFPDVLIGQLERPLHQVTIEKICPLCVVEKFINPSRDLPPETPPEEGTYEFPMWYAAKLFKAGEIDDVQVSVIMTPLDNQEILSPIEMDSIVEQLGVTADLPAQERGPLSMLLVFARVCRSHQLLMAQNEIIGEALLRIALRGGEQGQIAKDALTRATDPEPEQEQPAQPVTIQ